MSHLRRRTSLASAEAFIASHVRAVRQPGGHVPPLHDRGGGGSLQSARRTSPAQVRDPQLCRQQDSEAIQHNRKCLASPDKLSTTKIF